MKHLNQIEQPLHDAVKEMCSTHGITTESLKKFGDAYRNFLGNIKTFKNNKKDIDKIIQLGFDSAEKIVEHNFDLIP